MNNLKYKIFLLVFITSAFIAAILYRYAISPRQLASVHQQSTAETITLPPAINAYLQNSLLYGNYYNENQKFVVYFSQNCPPNFVTALETIKQMPAYQTQYAFLPRKEKIPLLEQGEAAADQDFSALCGQFCIINPARGEIFYIHGIAPEDAAELKHLFAALAPW